MAANKSGPHSAQAINITLSSMCHTSGADSGSHGILAKYHEKKKDQKSPPSLDMNTHRRVTIKEYLQSYSSI